MFKGDSPINTGSFRIDRSPLARAAQAKAGVYGALGNAVKSGVQKARDKREKAAKQEAVSAFLKKHYPKLSDDELKNVDPEFVAKVMQQTAEMESKEKQAELNQKKAIFEIAERQAAIGRGAAKLPSDIAESKSRAGMYDAQAKSAEAAAKRSAQEPSGLERASNMGDAGQLKVAYELMQSDDPVEQQRGRDLQAKIMANVGENKVETEKNIILARGEAEAHLVAEANRKANRQDIFKLQDKEDELMELINDTSFFNSGASMAATGWIPGTPNYDRKEDLKSIGSFIALEQMLTLKRNSPTGSTGFGQLSEKELEVLQTSIRSIKPDLSGPKLQENLRQVLKSFQRTRKLLMLENQMVRGVPPQDDNVFLQQIRQAGLSDEDAIEIFREERREIPEELIKSSTGTLLDGSPYKIVIN